MIRRHPKSTQGRSSAASDVYKRQMLEVFGVYRRGVHPSTRTPFAADRPLVSLSEPEPVSYTHLRAHETVLDLVCRLLLEKKKNPHHHVPITLVCHYQVITMYHEYVTTTLVATTFLLLLSRY